MPLPRPPLLAALLLLSSLLYPAAAQQPASTPPILPDPKLTPGDTLDVTLADLQEKGYSAKVRNVPISLKRKVYASYGIPNWKPGEYEVDHLVSLSLGGSNSQKNLWPESRLTQPWNAQVKDQLEYRLLALVRAGKVDLHTAQQEMATDWISAYKKYVSPTPKPGKVKGRRIAHDDDALDTETAAASPAPSASSSNVATGGDGQVWVNTKSGAIWQPGSRYYGKTKEGRYMSEADALAAGYHNVK